MENQYTIESLREKIKELEIKQEAEGKVLKAQLKVTYEYLKPSNILKSVVKDIVSSDTLKDDFINTAASYTSGLLTKKLIVGKSQNPLLKIIGLGIQFGITAIVNKNYDSIKDVFTQYINAFISNLQDSVTNEFSNNEKP
jgi:hypothetical protein